MIYLDNAATTCVSKEVKNVMLPFFDNIYGNASSLHSAGQVAKEHIEAARETVAKCLNAEPSEIYFTSGGTESDNWAISSACQLAKIKKKNHIITSAVEHHAVLHTLAAKEREGFKVTYLPVDKNGLISLTDLENAITDQTFLVTIMFANNEIGTIMPVSKIGKLCREKGILFHTDAVQAAGHEPIDVKKMNIDLLSLSAHKFHGPKGVGAMYARKGCGLMNFMHGGAQERNRRPGTENVAGIVGLAEALKIATAEMSENNKKQAALRDRLFEELSKIPHSKINGDKRKRLANNFNMCFEGIEGESLLLLLDDYGICASSGSACTSGSLDPSHVLLALGLPHEVAHGSLRLTTSKYTTEKEIEKTIKAVKEVVEKLRKMSPVWDELQKGVRKYVI